MTVKTTRKEKFEGKTNDGYTLIELTTNMSLPCWGCGAKPKKFFYKALEGKATICYCQGCKRG